MMFIYYICWMAAHNDIGKRGEAIARKYLLKKGYRVLVSNYRYRRSEVDLIARLCDRIIFVEVKTRTTPYLLPEAGVTSRKQELMVNAASAYLYENNLDLELRFDIIAIELSGKTRITHIEDAFFPVDGE